MGRPTKTLMGAKARKAILDGVNAIYEPVRTTLGPEGRNALLFRSFSRGSRITNDGYTVAECQEPKDLFVRLVATSFKESCKRTNEKVGDGTTTTITIAGALANDVFSRLAESQSDFVSSVPSLGVMSLRRQILEEAEKVKNAILNSSKKIETLEDLEKIATVSVEDKELGKVIANMTWEVGIDGFIDVVEGYKGEIETEINKGMRFPAKIAAKAFINNPARYEMVATDCPVFLTNYKIDNAADIAKSIKDFSTITSKIIVMAPAFSESVLIQMVNANKNGFMFYPVLVPSLRTEQFEDLAIYCGATFIDKNKGKLLRNVRKEDLGFLEKLIVKDTESKEDAVATGGAGTRVGKVQLGGEEVGFAVDEETKKSPIAERIEVLKAQLAETKEVQFKKLLERRIASMASAVGVIRVGDSTEANAYYRKLKIEDAVYACKAALRGGYVKGGGLCLKEVAEGLEEQNVLKKAILAPYEQIQSSVDGGIDIPEDVIDPTEAVYYAVEHATGVVANLITVDVITPETEQPDMNEGLEAIAKVMGEYVISNKIHLGLLKENEQEMERDRLNSLTGGLTIDEFSRQDMG